MNIRIGQVPVAVHLVRVLVGGVVTYVRRCHQNRKSTRIYANREPIHPRLAPLKSRGAGGSLGEGLNGF